MTRELLEAKKIMGSKESQNPTSSWPKSVRPVIN